MVGNLSSRLRDPGSIPGLGTKIPHTMGQLGPRAATTLEPKPQQSPNATTRTQHGKINKRIKKKKKKKDNRISPNTCKLNTILLNNISQRGSFKWKLFLKV